MNKEEWKKVRLGEVCEVICGRDYKHVRKENGEYPIYGSGGIMGYASDYRCPEYCTIIGRKGSINNPIYVETKFWNVDTAFGLNSDKEKLNPKYLYYFCKEFDFNKLNVAVTLPSLRRTDVLEISLPLPPLSVQREIVSELDLLSTILTKKRAQLAELDRLAAATFHQTFGDPIENPKHWPTKKLGEVCENCDRLRIPITQSDRKKGIYPYYGASGIVDYVEDYIFDGDYLLVSEDGANLLLRSTPIAFSIKGKNWVNNHAHVLKFEEMATQTYIERLINSIDISMYVTGAAQPKFTQTKLNELKIPLPPLSLQQTFASKIEAIEKQKELIKKSVAEVQTLLDATMDKYFG